MRPRTTFIFFLVAVALAAYFFLVDQPRRRQAQRELATERALTTVATGDVARVVIERGSERLHFAQRAGRWHLLSPVADLAEQPAVNIIVTSVTDAAVTRKLLGETEYAQFGLDPPELRLTFSGASDQTLLRLAVGGHTIDKSWVYGRIDGSDDVVLLPTGIKRYALRPVAEFRNRRVATFDLDQVTRYWLTAADGDLRWERGGEGWFTVEGADTVRGDTGAVEALLRRVRALRALAFIPPDAERVGRITPNPHGVLAIQIGNNRGITRLTVGAGAEDGLLAVVDTVVTWDHALAAPLPRVALVDSIVTLIFTPTLFDLRDRSVLHFQADELGRISLETPDTTALMVRVAGEWGHPNPALGDMDLAAARRFVNRLSSLRFSTIVSERGEHGFKGDHVVTLFDRDGHIIDRMTGVTGDDGLLCTSTSSRLLGAVDRSSWRSVMDALHRIQKR